MTNQKYPSRSSRTDDLRGRAAKSARGKTPTRHEPSATPLPAESLRLIHELQVHQIELELQNEELGQARAELEASRAKYFDLYDLAPVGYFTVSEQGLILEANLTAATLLGVARGALTEKPFSHFILPADQDSYYLRHNQVVEQGAPQAWEMRMVRPGIASFWAQLQAVPAQNGECRITLNDITERKKIEDAQHFLLKFGYLHPEEDFFNSLARYLAESLEMDFVCIDRLQGNELAARTVAVYVDGKFKDNVEYALKDTPCGEVVGKTICRFDTGVRHLFPQDAVLQEMAAESYVGTTLWSFDGRPIGLIAIIGRKPLTNPRLAESLLKLVAVRAAGELERKQAEEKIQALARFPSENPNPVLRLDRSGVILYANEAGQAFLRDWGCSVGEAAPAFWKNAAAEACDHDSSRTIEGRFGRQVFSVVLAPVAPAGYVNLYAQDITEQQRAEAKLAESEERYRVIVESSRELIFVLDADGRLRWINPASRALFAEDFAAIGDVDLFAHIHPEDQPRFAAVWQSIKDGEENPGKVGYRFRAPVGGYHTLESTFRKISLAGEELWCVISADSTEVTKLRRKVSAQQGIAGMVGRDPKMLELYASISELAEEDVPVLILGESGTGKELIASAIHREGPRAAKNFVAINCGAIPDTLLETELFGHVKGSFTGAIRDKKGRFELADGGTIFLDEVGDLSLAMQVRLLRVLQEGTFEKVGAEKSCTVDVRVISATNKDLRREVAANRFRQDLFYRLSVVPLTIPPLRERLTDIPLLLEHILAEEARRTSRRDDPARPSRNLTVARETLALLIAHRWPGNIRELQNVVRFALIKCKGNVLRPEHLPPSFMVPAHDSLGVKGRKPKLAADSAKKALEQAGGHPGEAARNLGVSRATLYRHLPKKRKQ